MTPITEEFVLEKLARKPLIDMDKLERDFAVSENDRYQRKIREKLSWVHGNTKAPAVAGSLRGALQPQGKASPVVKPLSNATYAIGRGMNLGSNFSQAYNTHIPEEVRARVELGKKLKELEEWKP